MGGGWEAWPTGMTGTHRAPSRARQHLVVAAVVLVFAGASGVLWAALHTYRSAPPRTPLVEPAKDILDEGPGRLVPPPVDAGGQWSPAPRRSWTRVPPSPSPPPVSPSPAPTVSDAPPLLPSPSVDTQVGPSASPSKPCGMPTIGLDVSLTPLPTLLPTP